MCACASALMSPKFGNSNERRVCGANVMFGAFVGPSIAQDPKREKESARAENEEEKLTSIYKKNK